jgi:hypothetical protein
MLAEHRQERTLCLSKYLKEIHSCRRAPDDALKMCRTISLNVTPRIMTK